MKKRQTRGMATNSEGQEISGDPECVRNLLGLASLWDIQAELSSQPGESESQKRDLSWRCRWEMEPQA